WDDLAKRYNRQEIAKVEPVVKAAKSSASPSNAEPTEIELFNKMIEEDRGPSVTVPVLSEREINLVAKDNLVDSLPEADLDFKYDTSNQDLALQSFYKRQDMLKRFSEQNV
ncbi:hypothetical protein AB4189_28925, partial [Vibrio sp. 10N.286.49.E1]